MKTAVVALGGNSLQPPNEKWTYEELVRNIQITCKHLISLIRKKYQIVITFGNAPQIGNLLIQQETGRPEVPAMPLDVCGAMTQGQLGYLIQNCVQNILKKKSVTVITRVLVDKNDKAFEKPTKPIGPFYKIKTGKSMINEPEGWRRVVPSPKPKRIIEIEQIKSLIRQGSIVIACGGGGIPVIYDKGLRGIDAVIDKDYSSELLASQLNAELLVFLTDVPYVYLNYNSKNPIAIKKMSIKEAKDVMNNFKEGSMKPKIEAGIRFLRKGKKVIITEPKLLDDALEGKAGTVME